MLNQPENEAPNDAEILYAVGLGLCRWSGIEKQLYSLFPHVIMTNSKLSEWASRAALDAMVSLNAKIQAVQSAANITISSPSLLYLVTKLLTKTSKLSKRRNQIAHFRLLHETSSNVLVLAPFFQAGTQSSEKLIKQLSNPLTADDIIKMSEEFRDLAIALHWLTLVVSGEWSHEAQPDVFLLLDCDPIRHILPHTGPRHGKRQRPPQS
ncbi:MAG: hypothetical protein ACSHXY_10020 [Alphaproteobacteria bacterium]